MPLRAPARPGSPTVTVPLQVKRIVWAAADGSCVIAACQALDGATVPQGAEPADFVAVCSGDFDGRLVAGAELHAVGGWETHKRYGLQLRVAGVTARTPSGAGLADWLEAVCPGIGPAAARRIVQTLGPNAMGALRADPAGAVGRVGKLRDGQRSALLQAAIQLRDDAERTDHYVWCREHGLGPATIEGAWTRWAAETRPRLTEDPYLLAELDHAGWISADELAATLGTDPLAPSRLRAALLFALDQAAETDGHTHRSLGEAVAEARRLIMKTGRPAEAVPEQPLRQAAEWLTEHRRLVRDGDRVWLPCYHSAEEEVAALVHRHAARLLR